MRSNSPEDATRIRQNCSMIETGNSQLEKIGLQGFMLKAIQASL
jgi:hypothetical protein